MNAIEVRGLLHELIDENPMAIRAMLRVVAVEFTDRVPTLAVTIEARPRLLVNLDFINTHCRTPHHVKAALCHEFLHMLLRHTSITVPLSPARHLAFDAVINAIIHRQLGSTYSELMSEFYGQAPGLLKLLRPMTPAEMSEYHAGSGAPKPRWWHAWAALYAGRLAADDIEQLAEQFAAQSGTQVIPIGSLLGNHATEEDAPWDPEQSPVLAEALDRAGRELHRVGVLRGLSHRAGAFARRALYDPAREARQRWRVATLAVLRKHLQPVSDSPRGPCAHAARLPVLSTGDRRAFLRARWSRFLPEAEWPVTSQRPEGRAQVYLDVSDSMREEMSEIVALLGRLTGWIQRPLWAFSTVVAPATIVDGRLRTSSSGGTRIGCVLEHVARTRPASAVIVTDGYIEQLPGGLHALLASGDTRLHAIVTRSGSPARLHGAGIAYSQLEKLPH